ncbi:MAG: MmgE/PrpD family protein [Betaproteobacteria bacterium]|nr:MmgE/PrpD family protein [Betaproteobacteria bacterium]
MSIALELAKRIHALRYEDLPPEAPHWARVGILDFLGVTLAGSREPAPRLVADAIGAPAAGASAVFGMGKRIGALEAALINGTASHALDFDDCNNTFGGHPSVPILPALFALADDMGANGPRFILAYVTGFEVEAKIAMGVHLHHYTKGWHPTATLGVFGAAAACSKLMGLDEERTATALAIAASLAAGIKSNFGTMVKPLHVGHCTRSGLFAAQLARAGFTANAAGVFEHKQGFLNVFNGEGTYDIARIFAHWADPFDIVKPGIAIKQYPCCGSTHPALDAMLALARKHDLKPDQVERIEAWTHARRLEHTNRPDPKSELDAKFSLQYCLARAITDRKIMLEHFEGSAYLDAAVRRLLPRIHVAPYTTAQFPAENHFGAEVKVHTRDGATFSGKVDQPFGRTSDNPLPKALLKEKFENCSARALEPDAVARLYAAVQNFENLNAVREVTALAAGESARPQRAAAA